MLSEFWRDSTAPFVRALPFDIRRQLDAACQGPLEQRIDQLWAIRTQEAACLPVYYLLHQLHALRAEHALAERAALAGLAEAGRQCGLPESVTYTQLRAAVDFNADGPARFWLLILSALSSTWRASGQGARAQRLRDWVACCDPHCSLGTDVLCPPPSA